uniref:SFRICE_004948 n=1 Tax=Spodoptera frugiperda TaxID=7108 RepID=A0A2H1W2Q8_SPOFR
MEEDIGVEREQQDNRNLTAERSVNEKEKGEQRLPEKRGRQDEKEIIEDDDGFTTVVRGHKKPARINSKDRDLSSMLKEVDEPEKCVVCVTSNKEMLPKQFGMAKWLRAAGIENITKMMYKGPYKVLIQFENRESALKLMTSTKLHELEYRAHIINELQFTYGILRQVDLEMDETEILENLKCEFEIESVKRLKRLDDSSKWINSETIKICFKSSTLPPYVYGYGCRFQGEPFTFPVSQCSICWKYGHLSRSCPNKNPICPKCGDKHANCETTTYICVNCKGPHMALNKKCPIFLKEKEIRNIMTKDCCTYRKALEKYIKKAECHKKATYQNEHEIHSQTSSNISNESVQSLYNTFIRVVNKATDEHIPMLKTCTDPNKCFQPKPYWNPSLANLVAQRRLALSQFRKNPTPHNLNILEGKTLEAKEAIRQAKSTDWQNYCSSIDEQTSSSEMWKRAVPVQWRDIYITPIPKSSPAGVIKLRPISLISCVCKLLHSILTRRLEWFIEKNKLLSPFTSGFRRGQSCQDCLVKLDWYPIFTDGAKNVNGQGAAFYVPNTPMPQHSNCFKIDEKVCIMTLELVAISEALSYVCNTGVHRKVVILTDSKSSLQHIARCASGSRGASIAYVILCKMDELTERGVLLRLQWVPSHTGLRGNEEADTLAKFAATSGRQINIVPDYSEFMPIYKQICFENWKEYFNKCSLEKGIWYKTIQCQPPHIPWCANTELNRKLTVTAHRLRSGHIPCNKFNFMMRKTDSPNCDNCGICEDLYHLLLECVRFEAGRNWLANAFKLNRLDVGAYNLHSVPILERAGNVGESNKICPVVVHIEPSDHQRRDPVGLTPDLKLRIT